MAGIDEVDRRLLGALQQDGRATLSSLSKRLKVPRVTLQYRLHKLVRRGVIRRFTALVDRRLDGTDFAAFVLVNLVSGSVNQRGVGESLAKLTGVVEVHDVTGRPDFVVKIRSAGLRETGDCIDRIRSIPGVATTETFPSVICYKDEA